MLGVVLSPAQALRTQSTTSLMLQSSKSDIWDLGLGGQPRVPACLRFAGLKKYNDETRPLIDFYKKKGILQCFNGIGSTEEISNNIIISNIK